MYTTQRIPPEYVRVCLMLGQESRGSSSSRMSISPLLDLSSTDRTNANAQAAQEGVLPKKRSNERPNGWCGSRVSPQPYLNTSSLPFVRFCLLSLCPVLPVFNGRVTGRFQTPTTASFVLGMVFVLLCFGCLLFRNIIKKLAKLSFAQFCVWVVGSIMAI